MKINGYELPEKANVLGTEYKFFYGAKEEDFELKSCNGYCDIYAKEIHIDRDSLSEHGDDLQSKNLHALALKVIRHELIHAFLFESGLCMNSDWATNEEMVDWIAIQFPKMAECFEETQIDWR